MKKSEIKKLIVSEFLRLPKEVRTDIAATALAFKCQDTAYHLYHNDYQEIMGWLGQYIEPRP